MNTSERNINYSYMMNQWGNINFKKVTNFNEWFMGDFDDSYYFQDWDKVLRYHAGAGSHHDQLLRQHEKLQGFRQ